MHLAINKDDLEIFFERVTSTLMTKLSPLCYYLILLGDRRNFLNPRLGKNFLLSELVGVFSK